MWGVGGLRGLGCGQLLGRCLVGHAVIHAGDRGLSEEVVLKTGAESRAALSLSAIMTVLSSQLCHVLLLRYGLLLTTLPQLGEFGLRHSYSHGLSY